MSNDEVRHRINSIMFDLFGVRPAEDVVPKQTGKFTVVAIADGSFELHRENNAIIRLCPCCDKPLRTRHGAEALAHNLTMLENDANNNDNDND